MKTEDRSVMTDKQDSRTWFSRTPHSQREDGDGETRTLQAAACPELGRERKQLGKVEVGVGNTGGTKEE